MQGIRISPSRIGKLIKGSGIIARYLFLYSVTALVGRKKNILFIPQHIHIGGTRTFFYQMLDLMTRADMKVHLLLHKDEYVVEQHRITGTGAASIRTYTSELSKIELWYEWDHPLKYHFLKDMFRQTNWLLQKGLSKQTGTTIVSSAEPASLLPVLRMPRKRIYIGHSMPWGAIDTGNRNILRIIKRKKHVELVTVSEFARSMIARHWKIPGLETKFRVIYNSYIPGENSLPETNPELLSESIGILTLGNMIQDKNPEKWTDIAIRLTEELPAKKLRFTWAGTGPLLEGCRERVKDYENIAFVGWREDVDELYTRHQIYFQPSNRESHGMGVLGAMYHGLPCLVTKNGGTIESVFHDQNGWCVDVEDSEAMYSMLHRLIKDRDLRTKFGREGRKRFDQCFSYELWKERYLSLIE